MKPALQPLAREENIPEGLDPAASVWVSASAGGGKTTLLVSRVLRLLLEGNGKPRKQAPRILCLTYTRAAAAEMQNRIHQELAKWVALRDDALRDELARQFGFSPDKDLLKHARRLFGQTLERPEQVRVATLHAFCQMVLNRFPLEAGVSPHFRLLEGDQLQAFQARALDEFFAGIPKKPESQKAFDYAAARVGPSRLKETFEQIFYNAQSWEKFFATYPSTAAFEQALCLQLGLDESAEEEAYLGPLCRAPEVNEKQIQWAALVLSKGSKTEKECAEKIAGWLENRQTRVENFENYANAFLTKEFEPRKKLVTKETLQNHLELADVLEAETRRVHAIMHRLLALRFLKKQTAWHGLFLGLWQVLQTMKAAQAVMTYDDLILRTRTLLQSPGVCGWVLYKLDGGIDHLLVDEAQDTSPAQWDILFALLDEFLSGQGARADVTRTVFVVGDEKQSIYSFQGADRSRYLSARAELFARLEAAQHPAQRLELKRSRRSPLAILQYVDAVFSLEVARAGVAESVAHETAREGEASYVELWPPVEGAKPEIPAPWTPPLTRDETKPAPVLLAENIAAAIRRWLDEGWILASKKALVEPGDILILLQRRSKLLLPIVRALKDAHVSVAGIDRMVLGQQPAVQDVFSLCRFLLLPEDDLTLAEVLRGPFIRLSDEQLFVLAHGRGEKALWQRLQESAHEKTTAYLKQLLSITDYMPAFALLNEILFKPCPADETSGQHALVRRLGPDAVDPLEQLLAAALLRESEAPSLQLFVQGVMDSEKEAKRELSKALGQVRILTVHSAKGLEAPVVIIPDLARDPNRTVEAPPLLWNEQDLPLVSGKGDDAVPLLHEAKDSAKLAELEEHRRLLYVALTRARDVLILCGLASNENKEAPWHEFCRKAMEKLSEKAGPDGIWRHGDRVAFAAPAKAGTSAAISNIALPEWIYKTLETAGEKRRFVNPSQVAATNEKILPPVAQQAAFRRGELMHRLLQMLPEVEEAAREDLAYEFLRAQSGETDEVCKKNAQEVMRVLHHPVFAPLFAAGSRAEVPVIGRMEGKRISGQIDRLAVTSGEVLIIDYKTNRPPPARAEDIPRQYRAQMSAYRALLEKIYPGKKIRCALLWTHTLQLMELDEAMHQEGLTILRGA